MREIGKIHKFVPYDEEPIPVRRVSSSCPVRALMEQIEGSVIYPKIVKIS